MGAESVFGAGNREQVALVARVNERRRALLCDVGKLHAADALVNLFDPQQPCVQLHLHVGLLEQPHENSLGHVRFDAKSHIVWIKPLGSRKKLLGEPGGWIHRAVSSGDAIGDRPAY